VPIAAIVSSLLSTSASWKKIIGCSMSGQLHKGDAYGWSTCKTMPPTV
jgi:hypothetical protein